MSALIGAVCRGCGVEFLDSNGHRLCDICLIERVNGAGILELDDPDDPINQRAAPWVSATDGLALLIRDYWRAEVAHGSLALARLERICGERGYDYHATLDQLK